MGSTETRYALGSGHTTLAVREAVRNQSETGRDETRWDGTRRDRDRTERVKINETDRMRQDGKGQDGTGRDGSVSGRARVRRYRRDGRDEA